MIPKTFTYPGATGLLGLRRMVIGGAVPAGDATVTGAVTPVPAAAAAATVLVGPAAIGDALGCTDRPKDGLNSAAATLSLETHVRVSEPSRCV